VIDRFPQLGIDVVDGLGPRDARGRERAEVVHDGVAIGRGVIRQQVRHGRAAAQTRRIGEKRAQPVRLRARRGGGEVRPAARRQAGVAAVAVHTAEFVEQQTSALRRGLLRVKAVERHHERLGAPRSHRRQQQRGEESEDVFHGVLSVRLTRFSTLRVICSSTVLV
jgi:hypothetical protein